LAGGAATALAGSQSAMHPSTIPTDFAPGFIDR
jgi:hypothetical protein